MVISIKNETDWPLSSGRALIFSSFSQEDKNLVVPAGSGAGGGDRNQPLFLALIPVPRGLKVSCNSDTYTLRLRSWAKEQSASGDEGPVTPSLQRSGPHPNPPPAPLLPDLGEGAGG